jgi:hypothetical protein
MRKLVALTLAIALAPVQAGAQGAFQSTRPLGQRGVGHMEHHQHYNRLPVNKGGQHCCNDVDCRPTQARWAGDHWEAMIDGVWKTIPSRAVLDQEYLQEKGFDRWDAQAHICASVSGYPYCLVPPDSGN